MLRLALSESGQLNLCNRWYIRGNALLAKRQGTLAEKYYQKILSFKSAGIPVDTNIFADTLHNLGMIAEERDDIEAAISYYSRVLEADQTHRMTWLFLAKLYFRRYGQSQRQSDYQAGLDALACAEAELQNFPAVRFLKQKYAIA